MPRGLSVVTPATAEPITLADAKKHARVFITDDDAYITGLITVARQKFERDSGYTFSEVEYDWHTDRGLKKEYLLPRFPIESTAKVVSIKYLDSNDTEQTVLATNYDVFILEDGPAIIELKDSFTLPVSSKKTIIRFKAGFTVPATAAPELVKHAIKFLVSHAYENREAYMDGELKSVPRAYESIVRSFTDDIFI